jgi:hypothetical protein
MPPAHGQPTEVSAAGDLARQLATILGPAYQAPDGSNNAAELLALGGALAAARDQLKRALDQAFVDTATDLLPELEAEYGLPVQPELSTTARQARLLAKVRAARAGSPQSILLAVRAEDPTATLAAENTPTTAAADGYPRGVFVWAVICATSVFDDPVKLARVKALVAQMAPAHTRGDVAASAGDFRFGVSKFGRDAF